MKFLSLSMAIFSFLSLTYADSQSSSVGPSFQKDLSLFCSSGGFLYNRLEVNEKKNALVFFGSGYDHGLNIAKRSLRIDPNQRFRGFSFEVAKKDCKVDIGNRVLVECFPREIEMTFYLSEREKTLKRVIQSIEIALRENDFRIHRFDEKQIVGMDLGQGCVDLTGL